jgi:hypothetical protein
MNYSLLKVLKDTYPILLRVDHHLPTNYFKWLPNGGLKRQPRVKFETPGLSYSQGNLASLIEESSAGLAATGRVERPR